MIGLIGFKAFSCSRAIGLELVSAISLEPVNRFRIRSKGLYGTIIPFIWRLLRPIRFSGHRETRLNKLRYTHTHIQTFSDLVELGRMVYDTRPSGPRIESRFSKRYVYPCLLYTSPSPRD